NNIGAAYMALGKRDEARQYYEQAKSSIGAHAPVDLELNNIEISLAMLTGDAARREALMVSAWTRFNNVLGEQHPMTLDALYLLAQFPPDPRRAFERMSIAAEGYATFHPKIGKQLARASVKRAFLGAELGEPSRAAALFAAARAATENPAD